jgi:DNA invertase Pin-like site-specific DNA recombinase
MSVAAWERETTGERTREALRFKIRNGERVGKIRFGFDLAADGRTLVENADEQAAIELMQQLRANGATLQRIAAELNARGIKPKESGQWEHSAVRRILKRQLQAA